MEEIKAQDDELARLEALLVTVNNRFILGEITQGTYSELWSKYWSRAREMRRRVAGPGPQTRQS